MPQKNLLSMYRTEILELHKWATLPTTVVKLNWMFACLFAVGTLKKKVNQSNYLSDTESYHI